MEDNKKDAFDEAMEKIMGIQVGHFIRTKRDKIGKIINISNVTGRYVQPKYLVQWFNTEAYYIAKQTIKKSSSSLINLVDIDDYVNGLTVIGKYLNAHGMPFLVLDTTDKKRQICFDEDIKTVVTKELYKSVEYEVK